MYSKRGLRIMPLIINCEKCRHLFENFAMTKPDGTTDDQMNKCPKCGHWNGMKHYVDRFTKK
ncbi:hypothetical protein MnTg01_00404 [archaeon MnTg01]|nr:hypothetical protein MnTg01_00404 [archaeon MnTg01]